MSTPEPILSVTSAAIKALNDGPGDEGEGADMARIGIIGRKDGEFQYDFEQIDNDDIQEGDQLIDCDSIKIYVAAGSEEQLKGATIDYMEDEHGRGGFHVENPNPIWETERLMRMQQLIDSDINPALAMHGGGLELLDAKEESVYVKMLGGCQGCSSSAATLKGGIEALIKEEFPEIQNVVDTTDHADGTNPYFTE